MTALWMFLSDPTNQAVLSWIGGGLAMICGGLWTVLTLFRKPATTPTSRGDGTTITTTTTNGLSGWPLVALIGALVGALVLIVALSGPRATATEGGVSVGGNVSGSSITTNR